MFRFHDLGKEILPPGVYIEGFWEYGIGSDSLLQKWDWDSSMTQGFSVLPWRLTSSPLLPSHRDTSMSTGALQGLSAPSLPISFLKSSFIGTLLHQSTIHPFKVTNLWCLGYSRSCLCITIHFRTFLLGYEATWQPLALCPVAPSPVPPSLAATNLLSLSGFACSGHFV